MTERLLLDTHSLLWVAEGGGRLRPNTLGAINDLANEVYVSAVNIWEIAIKLTSGGILPVHDLEVVLRAVVRYSFRELSMTFRHAALAGRLPLHHRDPFDRMLIAQAQVEGLTLVTDDSEIARYHVPILPAR